MANQLIMTPPWESNLGTPIYDADNIDGLRPASAWRSNEPGGLSQLTEKEFNTLSELETATDPSWYLTSTTGNKSIASDSLAIISRPNILRHNYPPGFAGGSSGTSAGYTNAAGVDEIYISLAVKWDANWEDHPTGTNKVFFVTSDTFGGGGDPVFLNYNTQTASPRLILYTQGPGMVGPLARIQEVNPVPGQWHIVEVYLKTNTADGVADGLAKLWMDGTLSTDLSNVEFWTGVGPDGKFNNVKLEPTWGGGGGTVVSGFNLDHDQIYISGA